MSGESPQETKLRFAHQSESEPIVVYTSGGWKTRKDGVEAEVNEQEKVNVLGARGS